MPGTTSRRPPRCRGCRTSRKSTDIQGGASYNVRGPRPDVSACRTLQSAPRCIPLARPDVKPSSGTRSLGSPIVLGANRRPSAVSPGCLSAERVADMTRSRPRPGAPELNSLEKYNHMVAASWGRLSGRSACSACGFSSCLLPGSEEVLDDVAGGGVAPARPSSRSSSRAGGPGPSRRRAGARTSCSSRAGRDEEGRGARRARPLPFPTGPVGTQGGMVTGRSGAAEHGGRREAP